MAKLFQSRWVDFLMGVGILFIAYLNSPQTTAEKFIALVGSCLAGLALMASWLQEQHEARRRGNKA